MFVCRWVTTTTADVHHTRHTRMYLPCAVILFMYIIKIRATHTRTRTDRTHKQLGRAQRHPFEANAFCYWHCRRLRARVSARNGLGTASAATVPTAVLWCRYTHGARTHGSRWVAAGARRPRCAVCRWVLSYSGGGRGAESGQKKIPTTIIIIKTRVPTFDDDVFGNRSTHRNAALRQHRRRTVQFCSTH